ncbi:MAG TPA: DinB family protein [Terriglobales bacterium]|nr:DinB family protein [Terriglobales bacterium]
MTAGPSFEELMRYTGQEAERWRAFFEQQPAALDAPLDIAGQKTARGLLMHIFAVEQRHSERLLGEPVTPPEQFVSKQSLDEIYGVARAGRGKLTQFLSTATENDMRQVLTFVTITAGEVTTSKRKLAVHILLHGIRHYAQLATAVRQGGYPQPWMHDIMFSDAME